MRRITKKGMVLLLNLPVTTLFIVFLIGANLSVYLPDQFYSNSIGMVAGIGFTMLGFGLAATSILTSVISTPTITRLRLSNAWKDLITTFTRSNIIFLTLGIFGLFVYKELFEANSSMGIYLRAAYIGILGVTFMTAGGIIYVLHKIVSAPLTPQEQQVAASLGLPNFAPPASSDTPPKEDEESVVVPIAGED